MPAELVWTKKKSRRSDEKWPLANVQALHSGCHNVDLRAGALTDLHPIFVLELSLTACSNMPAELIWTKKKSRRSDKKWPLTSVNALCLGCHNVDLRVIALLDSYPFFVLELSLTACSNMPAELVWTKKKSRRSDEFCRKKFFSEEERDWGLVYLPVGWSWDVKWSVISWFCTVVAPAFDHYSRYPLAVSWKF